MTWRLTQPVLLALVAVAWHHQGGGAAPAAGSPVRHLAWVEQGASPSRSPRETEAPGLHQAGRPMDGALCVQRHGQLRVEMRQPGLETWLGPAADVMAGTSPAWLSRLRAATITQSRQRLHVLLCTWLI
jgi:hypothetical protein